MNYLQFVFDCIAKKKFQTQKLVVTLGCPIKSQHYYGKLMQLIRPFETASPGCKNSILHPFWYQNLTFFSSVVIFLKIQSFFSHLSCTYKESKDFDDTKL